ncbi:MAG: hypothetical protein M0Z66_08285 [Thermaerobacter sp.]|nr:hypothetical protein [Thermaerobacter sp.]
MQRKNLLIGTLVALPLLVGGGVAAFAASGTASGTSPAAAFIADVASHLGISTSTLQNAVQQAELDRVQQEVTAGKLTSAQATKIEASIKAGKMGAGFGMMSGRRPHMMMDGRGAMQAAATYLGLTQQQLMTDLQGGKSLSTLTTSTTGKTVQGLEAAITAAMQTALQQAVTNGRMTQQQSTQAQSHLQQFVQQFVTRTGSLGGPHGGGHWGPPNGQQNTPTPPSSN